MRAVVGGAAEQLAALRALAADAGLADEDLAADVVQQHLELVQLGVDAAEPGELGLAQAAVRLGLDVVRGAVQLVHEAAEVAQQHLAGGAQERDAAAQLAAAGARRRGGGELVRVQARREVGDRLARRRDGRRCGAKGGGTTGGSAGAANGAGALGAAAADRVDRGGTRRPDGIGAGPGRRTGSACGGRRRRAACAGAGSLGGAAARQPWPAGERRRLAGPRASGSPEASRSAARLAQHACSAAGSVSRD